MAFVHARLDSAGLRPALAAESPPAYSSTQTMVDDKLNALLSHLLAFAGRMLRESGEFYPFAEVLRSTGEFVSVGASTAEEFPKSSDIVQLLQDGIRDMVSQAELHAAGYCFNALVVPPGETIKRDAIGCHIEDSNGTVARVYIPFRIVDGDLELEPILRVRAESQLFGPASIP
jgi:hypothetical protein